MQLLLIVIVIISYTILINIQISIGKELKEIREILWKVAKKESFNFFLENRENKANTPKYNKRLSKFKKGEYIPIEEVITDFNWFDLQIAIKEQAPNIELCYLVRAYGSTDFKIITANELKELDNAGKLDNLFISPLFKIL